MRIQTLEVLRQSYYHLPSNTFVYSYIREPGMKFGRKESLDVIVEKRRKSTNTIENLGRDIALFLNIENLFFMEINPRILSLHITLLMHYITLVE